MTADELKAAQAELTNAENELAGINAQIRDCIEQARLWNSRRKAADEKRVAVQAARDTLAASVREEIARITAEAKRKANEEAAARAEAAKKAAEEAAAKKAAEPPQPTELELLRLEVAALRDELKK